MQRAVDMQPFNADWLASMAETKCYMGDHKVRARQGEPSRPLNVSCAARPCIKTSTGAFAL